MTKTVARRWITDWDPENEAFWRQSGARIARRNLIYSVLAEHLGFSLWLLWSVVAVSLPAAGFQFTVDQLFWLVAVPNLVGSVMRIPYTMAVARFGGRNWTTVSAALLLIPIGLMAYCVSTPGTPYEFFLVAAATAGLGGGNFASSMANISYFYPEKHKGAALGINAAGGNLGVAVAQFAVPAVIGTGAALHLANAPLLWLVPVLAATACAWLFMDNLTVSRASVAEQTPALRNRHTWIMSFLYIGTFGSFIGYSSALPLLIKSQFPEVSWAYWAAIGPLIGSLARPAGGWLADRAGGARVTLATFAVMGLGVAGVLGALAVHSFALFALSFALLFVTSGLGNGSTYRMIPAIFRAQTPTLAEARKQAATVIGLAAAIGALGGFLIPRGFAASISATGSLDTALWAFLAGYAICAGATWWFYLRTVWTARVPSLAHAGV
ncbi:NarK family nitrate/nitrite MFS transporter [Longispora albida]|uniref:NarK family nitrate/nitrite MFS transporter n=1 Tax=Longispora albida TaxID=203523 RepID=UPI00039D7BF4|nr:NarK family nitrate/nitrite MFS transporter [Longispora albida]